MQLTNLMNKLITTCLCSGSKEIRTLIIMTAKINFLNALRKINCKYKINLLSGMTISSNYAS